LHLAVVDVLSSNFGAEELWSFGAAAGSERASERASKGETLLDWSCCFDRQLCAFSWTVKY